MPNDMIYAVPAHELSVCVASHVFREQSTIAMSIRVHSYNVHDNHAMQYRGHELAHHAVGGWC